MRVVFLLLVFLPLVDQASGQSQKPSIRDSAEGILITKDPPSLADRNARVLHYREANHQPATITGKLFDGGNFRLFHANVMDEVKFPDFVDPGSVFEVHLDDINSRIDSAIEISEKYPKAKPYLEPVLSN